KLGSKYVRVKGGRLDGPAVVVLYDGKVFTEFEAPRIDTVNTSRAGCSYSAAITANLANDMTVVDGRLKANNFVTTVTEGGFTYTEAVRQTYHADQHTRGEAHKIKMTQSKK